MMKSLHRDTFVVCLSRGLWTLLLSGIVLLLSACAPSGSTDRGLALPLGNTEAGNKAFIELNCVQCHSVAKLNIAEVDSSAVLLELGGEVRRVQTYSELITSITNPDHRISGEYLKKLKSRDMPVKNVSSPMVSLIDDMSVRQLIDLITFLDTYYEKALPDYVGYGIQYVQH